MGEVTITVNGRPYRMACEDGQEDHLHRLGDELSGRVNELVGQVGQVGDAQLLVMAALITADEADGYVAGEPDPALARDLDAVAAERDRLREELAALEALRQDRTSEEAERTLAAERDALREELAALQAAHEALRNDRSAEEAAAAGAAERQALQEEAARLRADLDAREQAAAEAAQEREALEAELARLREAREAIGGAAAEESAEPDALTQELAALRSEHEALRQARAEQAEAEAHAARAIEALSGRVARLAEALRPG